MIEETTDLETCRAIRRAVFIVEQAVPEAEEWDGRDGEAMARLYRELDGDNFDQRDREQLKLGEVIEYLSTHGDSERALAYARESFERLPEAGVFRRLVSLADDDEHRDSLKEWALSIARARDVARGSANHLVEIHLAEGEPDAAWAAVHELGRSYQWQELISQTSDTHPAECAAMLTLEAEGQLTVADNAHYRRVAELLTREGGDWRRDHRRGPYR